MNNRTPHDPPVTLYSQPGCQPCRATKRFLQEHHIPYIEYDVTEDEGRYQHIVDLGYKQVPVVASGFNHWSGFRPDLLAEIPR